MYLKKNFKWTHFYSFSCDNNLKLLFRNHQSCKMWSYRLLSFFFIYRLLTIPKKKKRRLQNNISLETNSLVIYIIYIHYGTFSWMTDCALPCCYAYLYLYWRWIVCAVWCMYGCIVKLRIGREREGEEED